MMTDQPSRRNVVRAAAWSAPVVVVATAAPALAASPTVGALTFARGATAYESHHDIFSNLAGVVFDGAALTATGPDIAANALRASITSNDPANHRADQKPGDGWIAVGDHSNGQATYAWVYSLSVPSGSSPSFFRGTNWSLDRTAAPDPDFTVMFTAAGYEPAFDVFVPPSN